jgi:putative intracellular protease/amidase/uncharacterized protein (DUF952 family)
VRWLYHLAPRETSPGDRYAPPSLAREGFLHASFADAVAESARLHFAPEADLVAWRIDPRRLDVDVDLAITPRGPMPHLAGSLVGDAVREVCERASWSSLPDRVTGHRVAFVAFEGMTLLDLVGPLDAVSRLRTMGFDPSVVTEVIGVAHERVWTGDGATLTVSSVRPDLDAYDVVVIPGGFAARDLACDEATLSWLRKRSANRLWASVCTGSLVLGAMGLLRGRSATTHHLAFDQLGLYEGVSVKRQRVVRDGPVITAGGVTSGLDLGLALVAMLSDDETAQKIAAQMELPSHAEVPSGS